MVVEEPVFILRAQDVPAQGTIEIYKILDEASRPQAGFPKKMFHS